MKQLICCFHKYCERNELRTTQLAIEVGGRESHLPNNLNSQQLDVNHMGPVLIGF